MKIKHGSYTGDGSTPRAITGIGFAPDLVIVKNVGVSTNSQIRFAGQSTSGSLDMAGNQARSQGILSLDADGFTVGSDTSVNYSGHLCVYLAIQDDDGALCTVGTYVGSGVNGKEVNPGFQPDFVLVRADSTLTGMRSAWTVSAAPANVTKDCTSIADYANGITALTATGFTLGTDAKVNVNGRTYLYIAVQSSAGAIACGRYTGNGVDNRNITGVGFQANSVVLKAANAQQSCWRHVAEAGDNTTGWTYVNELPNLIQALQTDGFQVGSDNRANQNTIVFDWWAVRDGTHTSTTAVVAADSGQGADATVVVGEITIKTGSDSAATDKERAGYYTLEHMYYIPEGPGGPPWMWVFHSGVEASYIQQQDVAATEGAGQVVHNQLAASDSGALTDEKVEPPVVEHLREEPGAGVDLADLWYEIALSDSNVSADDQAVIEINPVAGSDSGAGAEAAQTPVGYYEGADAGVGADALAGVSAALSGITDAASALETAQQIAILSRHIIECSIESSLEALADAFDLTLVESDPSDPLTPKAQAWRSLDEGDLVQVRLGLAGLGFDDYGTFRIDGAAVRVSERQIVAELHGRDKAALLVEERGRDPGGAHFAFGAYPEQDATQATRPYCSSIAHLLAARVGLGLIWDAPNYPLKEFTVRPDESVSSALNRLLGPLQVSRRCRADAWVDGENLVVRRRGNGPLVGALDCRQGLIRSIARERQPTVGEVTVSGGTEVIRTTYVPEDHQDEHGSDDRESQVEIEDDGSGHRVVRTYLQRPDGTWVQTQEEVEDQDFEEVWDGDRWIGRVLLESRTTITTNMHLSTRKTERRTTRLSYDGEWRLIRREESKRVYNSDSHEFELKEKSLVRFEQITPTDVRTTTTEWKVVDGELKVKSGYPQRVEQPGTLQSALHTTSSPDNAWDQREDGKQPEQWRKVEETRQYQGSAVGTMGGIPREHSDANLMSDGACDQIAEDMASESGKWLYQFELFWPRPLPYRKGDRVTLTNLPADMPDMVAIITRVRTRFSVAEAAWTHDISLEAWADT